MFANRFWISVCVVGTLCPVAAQQVVATGPAKPSVTKPSALSKPDNRPTFTAEREAAALLFVTTHHPELRAVLNQLKSMQQDEYESAIRQIFQTSEQLSRTRDADPRRYELDLEDWRIKSRIQLLVARAGLSEDPALEAQLKELVERQMALRIKRLTFEKERAQERLTKADALLARVTGERSTEVERQYANLMRSIKRSRATLAKQDAQAKASNQNK